jgi:CheY-like chemotaxis protein
MTDNDKTVIIADDHETLVMYLSILMRRMGFTVIPAQNGEEVLNILESIIPDLVITDLKMPIVDGLTVLKVMKNDLRFSDIPVIMVSAYYEQQTFDECMDLGGTGFLTKPINIHDLHMLLRECITYSNNTSRKNMRVSYGNRVVTEHDNQKHEYYAVTLSEQGIYLRTQNPLPVGTEIQIHLRVQPEQLLTAKGTVIYQKNLNKDINKVDPGMAIKFTDLSDQHANVLKTHITQMLAGDLMEEQQETVIESEGLLIHPLEKKVNELKQAWRLS